METDFETETGFELGSLTGHLLRLGHLAAQRAFLKQFGRDGLTSLQAGIVMAVHGAPGIDHRSLVARMQTPKSVLTTAIKPLLISGILTQHKGEQDSRVASYRLSAEGRATIPSIYGKLGDAEKLLTSELTEYEIVVLRDLLKKIVHERDAGFPSKSEGSKNRLD